MTYRLPKPSMKFTKPLLALCLIVTMGLAYAVLSAPRASAGSEDYWTVYNKVRPGAPADIADSAATACAIGFNGGSPWHVFQTSWLSPAGDPTGSIVEVDRNQKPPIAKLQLNTVTYRCDNVSQTVNGRTHIDDARNMDVAGQPQVAGLVGKQYVDPYVQIGSVGVNYADPTPFDFYGPFSGYNEGDLIHIKMTTRGNLQKSNDDVLCAVQANPKISGQAYVGHGPGSYWDFTGNIAGSCEPGDDTVTIRVHLKDTPPTPHVTASCDTGFINYRISDPEDDTYDAYLIWNSDRDPTDTAIKIGDNKIPSDTPGDVYKYGISNREDLAAHEFQLLIVSNGPGNINGTKWWVLSNKVSVGPCATTSCKGNTSFDVSEGDNTSITGGFTSTIAAKGDPRFYNITKLVLSGPSGALSVTPNTTQGGAIGPAPDNDASVTWAVASSTAKAGVYSGQYTFMTGGAYTTCPVKLRVSASPYLRAWRGDVVAGCNDSTSIWSKRSGANGRIYAFNKSDGGASGSDLAVQALNLINGFSSRQKSAMTVQDYLTFANGVPQLNADSTTLKPQEPWGGRFGVSQCAPDYWAARPTSAPAVLPGSITGLATGNYLYDTSSNHVLGASAIDPGQHVTIYVDGDLTIAGDITIKNTSAAPTINDIPSLTVIVRGDIYVDHSVKRIEGTFVAEPKDGPTSDAGGTIITCSNNDADYTDQTQLITNCGSTSSSSLSVYGSMIARRVKFTRLKWSVSSALAGDTIGAGGVPAGTAAEKFIFTPETWLAAPTQNSSTNTYDAITSLPPVF